MVAALFLVIHLAVFAAAQEAGRIGKNHQRVKRLFRPVIARANESTVRVLSGRPARDVALAAVIGARGHLLTRMGDFSGPLTCRLADGRRLTATKVAMVPRFGLMLLHVDASGLKPVVWCAGPPPPVGSLVVTPGRGPDPVAIGVVSVPVGCNRSRAAAYFIGQGRGQAHFSDLGFGRQEAPIGRKMSQPPVRERLPVGLAAEGGGGPRLQHDSILRPIDCGGPLVDLSGRVVGVNVARVDRVTSCAVPARVVHDALRQLVAEHDGLTLAIPAERPFFGNAAPSAARRSKTDLKIAVLRKLETKVRKTARRAVACTVALRLGRVMGSGVLVSEDGLIATVAHVWQGTGRKVNVLLADGHAIRGRGLGANRRVDVALVKTGGSGPWPFVDPTAIAPARAGQWCVATGHPHGYRPGRPPVVRLGRILIAATDAVVTDCVLTRGDSGGPLFDIDGNLIGIHTMVGRSLANNVHVPVPLLRGDWNRLVRGEVWGQRVRPKNAAKPPEPPDVGADSRTSP